MRVKYTIRQGLALMGSHFQAELKSIFSDKGALLILIGAMLIYPVIYSIGYMHETMTELPFAVVDLDRTTSSQKYTNMLDASAELRITDSPNSLAEAKALFLENKVCGVLLIENGFQKDIYSGQQAHVALYADASYFLKYRNEILAVTYANAYFSGAIAMQRYIAEGQSVQQAAINIDPLQAQPQILYNPATAYGSFIMPGLLLIIIQQTLLIGIGVLGGSFSESKVSPFRLSPLDRKHEIIPYLLGKTGAYIAISLFNIMYALVWVHQWFDYPDKARFIDLLILVFPYCLAVIFLGIGIATLFKHRESSIVFMVFLSPIALFFTGLSWPVSAMPDWIVLFSKIMPSTNVVPAYLRLRTMGVGIMHIQHEVAILYLQALVYFILLVVYFYFRLGRQIKAHANMGTEIR